MAAPSAVFTTELGELVDALAKGERMVTSLHDLGAYEELPAEALRRLQRKGTVLSRTREDLAGIPTLIEGRPSA